MASGGKREGSGRKPSGDSTHKFSISAKESEYQQLKALADKSGKTLSRFLVELALVQNRN